MKYTSEAARDVVKSMELFRSNIESTTSRAMSATSDFSSWRDDKHVEFCNAMSQVLGDIKNGAYVISSYAEHLAKRIRELEGS